MDWAKAAYISQVAATFIAAISAVFASLQIRAARQSAEFSSLIQFHKDFVDHERLLRCATDTEFPSIFIEYLNLLEAYAAIERSSLTGRTTQTQIVERLRDAVAVVELDEHRSKDLLAATSTPMAFSELKTFIQKYRPAIERSKKQLRCADVQRGE